MCNFIVYEEGKYVRKEYFRDCLRHVYDVFSFCISTLSELLECLPDYVSVVRDGTRGKKMKRSCTNHMKVAEERETWVAVAR